MSTTAARMRTSANKCQIILCLKGAARVTCLATRDYTSDWMQPEQLGNVLLDDASPDIRVVYAPSRSVISIMANQV